MSVHPVEQERRNAGELQYEISSSGEVISLTFQTDEDEVSFSITRQSARLLGFDILTATDRTTHNDDEEQEQSEFIFE